MPIQPPPFKFVCPNCGYTKVHQPKSDALNPLDFFQVCPKCGSKMKKEGVASGVDIIVDKLKSLF